MHWLHALYAMTAFYFGVVFGMEFAHLENPFFCLFKTITGLPCFSCGTTRAVMLLLEGKLIAALRMHPNVVIFALAMPVFTALLLYDLVRQTNFSTMIADKLLRPLKENKPYQLIAISYVIIIWSWNIQKGI